MRKLSPGRLGLVALNALLALQLAACASKPFTRTEPVSSLQTQPLSTPPAETVSAPPAAVTPPPAAAVAVPPSAPSSGPAPSPAAASATTSATTSPSTASAAPSIAPPATPPVAPAAAAPPAPPPAPPTQEFRAAISSAVDALIGSAQKIPAIAPAPPRPIIIDPLVDGNTGAQTVASDSMGQVITALITSKYPTFQVKPFARPALDDGPLLLIGTLTAINLANNAQARNDRYRICLALIDLKSGKVVAKGVGRATEESVDATPTSFYTDAPTITKDKVVDGYVKTCQGTRAGDAADSIYVERLVSAMAINDATQAYNEGRYADAARLYRTALSLPGGDQSRTVTGLYLANWKLGRRNDASDAFGRLVSRGLDEKRLSLKLLFQPGSTEFISDGDLRAQYSLWLKTLAQRTSDFDSCITVVGHTSRSGNDAINDPLSLRRAEFVRSRLERESREIGKQLSSLGVGSREAIIGTGSDDRRDAIDRRVEFRAVSCAKS